MDAMTNTDPTSATTPGTANIDATCARLETQVTESMARTKSEAETVKARWEADQKRLKRKLNKNMELHRSDNMRMMQENVTLVKEINDLRREIKQMRMAQRANAMAGASGGKGGSGGGDMGGGGEAARLRQRIDELEAGAMVANRPTSRERLPAMEGVTPAQ